MSELSEFFVINAQNEIVQKPKKEQETVLVCPWCYSEAYRSRVDSLDMCPECGCIEDVGVKELTLAEWLEEHG